MKLSVEIAISFPFLNAAYEKRGSCAHGWMRGTPYKYFRIVAITDLSIGETLVGASVSYTPRLINQLLIYILVDFKLTSTKFNVRIHSKIYLNEVFYD